MAHLPIERLAELADGEPDATERAHLAECVMCSTELAAYQRLVSAASDERRRIAPPLTNWRALRVPLREEGLIITQEHQIAQHRRAVVRGWMWRAAAAVKSNESVFVPPPRLSAPSCSRCFDANRFSITSRNVRKRPRSRSAASS